MTLSRGGVDPRARARRVVRRLFAAGLLPFAALTGPQLIVSAAAGGWSPWGLTALVGLVLSTGTAVVAGASTLRNAVAAGLGVGATTAALLAADTATDAGPRTCLALLGAVMVVGYGRRAIGPFVALLVLYVFAAGVVGPPGLLETAVDDAVVHLGLLLALVLLFETAIDILQRNTALRRQALADLLADDAARERSEAIASRRGVLHDGAIGTLTRIADFGGVDRPSLDAGIRALQADLRASGEAGPEPARQTEQDGRPAQRAQQPARVRLLDVVADATGQSLLRSTVRTGRDVSLSATQATALRRAIGEALRNVERHAGVDEVEISWRATSRQIALEIIDRGRGIVADHDRDHDRNRKGASDASAAGGYGTSHSLTAALGRVGGSVSLVATPGGGTTVRLVVPRQHDDRLPWLRRTHADITDALGGNHRLVVHAAGALLISHVWLAVTTAWEGPARLFQLALAVSLLVATVCLARRLARPLTALTLGWTATQPALVTGLGVAVLGGESLVTYDSWYVGFSAAVVLLTSFYAPLVLLPALVLPGALAVVGCALVTGTSVAASGGSVAAVVAGPLLGGFAGAVVRRSERSVKRAQREARTAATRRHRAAARVAADQRLLRPARERLLPWLERLLDGRLDPDDPAVRREARLLAATLRDDLHTVGALPDAVRERIAAARRAGATVVITAADGQGPDEVMEIGSAVLAVLDDVLGVVLSGQADGHARIDVHLPASPAGGGQIILQPPRVLEATGSPTLGSHPGGARVEVQHSTWQTTLHVSERGRAEVDREGGVRI